MLLHFCIRRVVCNVAVVHSAAALARKEVVPECNKGVIRRVVELVPQPGGVKK
jgi:hypothetical protein